MNIYSIEFFSEMELQVRQNMVVGWIWPTGWMFDSSATI